MAARGRGLVPAAIIDYTNHAGKRATRRIEPKALRFGASVKREGQGWVIDAIDLERGVERSFLLADIHSWRDEA